MISLEAYSDLLATLYAAPLDTGHWQHFLGQLCSATESLYGIFTSNDSALERRLLAHSGMPAFAEAHRTYNQSFRHRDPFRERFLRSPRIGVIEGDDLFPHRELVQTDLYREFLRPLDLHHMTFVVLSMSPRKYELISMWRGEGHPHLETETLRLLRLLVPHIQTALQVRHVLGTAELRANNAEALLDRNPTPSILLDEKGSVVGMNAAARTLVDSRDGLQLQGDQLAPTTAAQRTRFRSLITAATAPARSEPGAAINLERRSGKRDLQVLITPFRDPETRNSNARVLVLVTDPETRVHHPDAILRALYDFTPAETEIANGLLTGYSLDEVATLRKTSLATTRSQMKSLFGKTSTRRQGELIQLLSSLPRTAPTGAHATQ